MNWGLQHCIGSTARHCSSFPFLPLHARATSCWKSRRLCACNTLGWFIAPAGLSRRTESDRVAQDQPHSVSGTLLLLSESREGGVAGMGRFYSAAEQLGHIDPRKPSCFRDWSLDPNLGSTGGSSFVEFIRPAEKE